MSLPHGTIVDRVFRLPGCEPIYVTIEHTESSRDENRVVDFSVGGILCLGK